MGYSKQSDETAPRTHQSKQIPRSGQQALDQRLANLQLLILDFDGVLTDDRVWVFEDGREAVACHRGDGMGISLLQEAGLWVVVVSKETGHVVAQRCRKLGLPCRQGVQDKEAEVGELVHEYGVQLDRVAFVGNDINDLPAMRIVGLGVCVADAHPDVIDEADVCLNYRGGHGAVREIADRILKNRRTDNNHD